MTINKKAVIVFGILTFFGAGCIATVPSMQQSPIPNKISAQSPKKSTQVDVVSEADFISSVMKTENSWQVYTNTDARVSFQYPLGFFTEAKQYGDQASGMRYSVEAKSTKSEDGVCDGLGDVDCDIAQWPIRYTVFKKALQGSKYAYFGYESVRVAQQIRIINGVRFVVGVSQGLNGSCDLDYVRATPTAYISFSINICDDSSFDVPQWFGAKVSAVERLKAENILASKNISDSTRIKIQAMEKVIATLKMQ